jgi:hypothetical protein
MTKERIEKIRCRPAGSVGTALDVNVDQHGKERTCGMCWQRVDDKTVGDLCPHCDHRFNWFQLLTDITALGDQVRGEKGLAAFIKKYHDRLKREMGPCHFDNYDGEG